MSVLLSYNVSSVIESKSVEGSSVTVTNTDDDTAGLQVIQSGNVTDEAGNQTAFFTLALTSEPVIPVTITPHTSDATESSFDVQQLTFNSNILKKEWTKAEEKHTGLKNSKCLCFFVVIQGLMPCGICRRQSLFQVSLCSRHGVH